jgi:hypothetical protein
MDIDEISTSPGTGAQGGGLADEAKQAAQDAKAAVAREMDEAKARARGAARQIKDGARDAGGRVASLLSEQTERQKSEVAESLRAVAQTMIDAAADQPEGMGARLVSEAAWRLEDVSTRLDNHSVAEMAEDVSRFGRQNPGLFLASCLAVGFAAGRFLTAGPAGGRSDFYRSDDDRDDTRPQSGFGATPAAPDERFAGYAAGATGATASPYAAGSTGSTASPYAAGSTASPSSDNAWASGSQDGDDATGDADADVNDPFAQEGVAPDTRVGTGFPADAGSDERAPFGTGAVSEGEDAGGSPLRGGGRDGGF